MSEVMDEESFYSIKVVQDEAHIIDKVDFRLVTLEFRCRLCHLIIRVTLDNDVKDPFDHKRTCYCIKKDKDSFEMGRDTTGETTFFVRGAWDLVKQSNPVAQQQQDYVKQKYIDDEVGWRGFVLGTSEEFDTRDGGFWTISRQSYEECMQIRRAHCGFTPPVDMENYAYYPNVKGLCLVVDKMHKLQNPGDDEDLIPTKPMPQGPAPAGLANEVPPLVEEAPLEVPDEAPPLEDNENADANEAPPLQEEDADEDEAPPLQDEDADEVNSASTGSWNGSEDSEDTQKMHLKWL